MDQDSIPDFIRGSFLKDLKGADPLEAFYGFLEENETLFGLSDPRNNLKLVKMDWDTAQGEGHARFQQYHEGLRVSAGTARMVFSRSGRKNTLGLSVERGLDLPATPVIPKEEAEALAMALEEFARYSPDLLSAELLYYSPHHRTEYFLAWEIRLMSSIAYRVHRRDNG